MSLNDSDVPQNQGSSKLSAFYFSGSADSKKKTAFKGVFVPTCENLWPVIIFLRFYYIVGQAGVIMSLVVVLISFLNSLLTSISLSAIAISGSNLEKGGPYYMISRTLGPYLGASIALVYFLGLVLLGVLEVVGGVVVFKFTSDVNFDYSTQLFSAFCLLFMGLLIFISPKMVKKLSVVFFTILVLTIVFYFVGLGMAPYDTESQGLSGLSSENLEENLYQDYSEGVNFFVILAVFFPCFACIFSGSHKGPELKDPGASIPKGTISAVVFSWVMYSVFMVLWGGVAHREYLKGNFGYFERKLAAGGSSGEIVSDISILPAYILEVGIIVASLSFGLQCFIVAYKMIKSIAVDNIISIFKILAVTWKGEPIPALIFTISLAEVISLVGNLDTLAEILTMCFLMMYVMINFSCFILCFLLPPSFKPPGIRKARWRYIYKLVALSGTLLSIVFMFMIQWLWAIVVVLFTFTLYFGISYKGFRKDWGSAMEGLKYQVAMLVLHNYSKEKEFTINWRPQVLCHFNFSEKTDYKVDSLVKVLGMMGKAKGLMVILGVISGDPCDPPPTSTMVEVKNFLIDKLNFYSVKAFPKVMVSESNAKCISYGLLTGGLRNLMPNTLLLCMPVEHNTEKIVEFCEIAQLTFSLNKALIVVKEINSFDLEERQQGNIDIWWIIHDGGILVYLSYLLSQHKIWKRCNKRIFIVGENITDKEGLEKEVRSFFRDHLGMEVETFVREMNTSEIGPYTIDWTFRVKNRKKIVETLKTTETFPNVIEHESIKSKKDRKKGMNIFINKFLELNQAIKAESSESPLVLMTLPEPSFEINANECQDYCNYLNTLSSGLKRVIFMLGSGTELIQKA